MVALNPMGRNQLRPTQVFERRFGAPFFWDNERGVWRCHRLGIVVQAYLIAGGLEYRRTDTGEVLHTRETKDVDARVAARPDAYWTGVRHG